MLSDSGAHDELLVVDSRVVHEQEHLLVAQLRVAADALQQVVHEVLIDTAIHTSFNELICKHSIL